MGTEIERKFLVISDQWRSQAVGQLYRQGYIVAEPEKTVRVRIVGDRGYLTIKGKTTRITRLEFEYEIPLNNAEQLLDNLCQPPLIEKMRYTLAIGNLVWEIDEFMGENSGLILAEVELENEDQSIAKPDWVGEDVSQDIRYYNANLSKFPFSQWT